jgi:hypothetical protein
MPPADGMMAYTHSHQCWVAVAPVRGVETHQRWDALGHQDGRAELRLVDDRAMHRGDVATLTPPGDVHNVADARARRPGPPAPLTANRGCYALLAPSGSRSAGVASSRSVVTVRWRQAASDSARALAAAVA